MSGRCRRAASIPAKTRGRRPSASLGRNQRPSVEKLGEVPDWLTTTFRARRRPAWKGRYRGQRQKWYALRFTGKDSEINVVSPGGGHKAEFVDWRWEPMRNLPELIVPFKRQVYERVVKEFSRLADGPVPLPRQTLSSQCRDRVVQRGRPRADRPPLQGRRAGNDFPALNGRCRRAASMPTKIRAKRQCANSRKRPAWNVEYLGETDWMTYEFPPYDGPPHRLAKFRGQRQKWFALRFTGEDDEIAVTRRNDQPPEFDAWRWEPLGQAAASWCRSAARCIGWSHESLRNSRSHRLAQFGPAHERSDRDRQCSNWEDKSTGRIPS